MLSSDIPDNPLIVQLFVVIGYGKYPDGGSCRFRIARDVLTGLAIKKGISSAGDQSMYIFLIKIEQRSGEG